MRFHPSEQTADISACVDSAPEELFLRFSPTVVLDTMYVGDFTKLVQKEQWDTVDTLLKLATSDVQREMMESLIVINVIHHQLTNSLRYYSARLDFSGNTSLLEPPFCSEFFTVLSEIIPNFALEIQNGPVEAKEFYAMLEQHKLLTDVANSSPASPRPRKGKI